MADESTRRWRAAVAQPLETDAFHPPSASVTLEIAAASATGRLRTHNTDHYLATRFGRLQETLVSSLAAADLPDRFEEYAYAMMVADGLGDDGAGIRASRAALSALAHLAVRYGRWNVRIDPDTLADITEQGQFLYRQANQAVIKASEADLSLAGMATSLTALYIAERDLIFSHVGHSRAYLFRSGVLTRLTRDHTRAREAEDAAGHRCLEDRVGETAHVVTKTIGGRREGPDVDIEHIALTSGDRLLLCTNGLTDVVSDAQIADVLALQRRPRDDCQRLIGLAFGDDACGDDVTTLVADYRLRTRTSQPEESLR